MFPEKAAVEEAPVRRAYLICQYSRPTANEAWDITGRGGIVLAMDEDDALEWLAGVVRLFAPEATVANGVLWPRHPTESLVMWQCKGFERKTV